MAVRCMWHWSTRNQHPKGANLLLSIKEPASLLEALLRGVSLMLSCLPWLPATFPSGAAPASNTHTCSTYSASWFQTVGTGCEHIKPDVHQPALLCMKNVRKLP